MLDGSAQALAVPSRDYGDYTGLAGTSDGVITAWLTGPHANSELAWARLAGGT